jgi:hypothetical protein
VFSTKLVSYTFATKGSFQTIALKAQPNIKVKHSLQACKPFQIWHAFIAFFHRKLGLV